MEILYACVHIELAECCILIGLSLGSQIDTLCNRSVLEGMVFKILGR